MIPFDAISPYYRVPLLLDENVYPSTFSLRVLAIGAYALNWISWLSRIESYSSLGHTRSRPVFLGKSIAACVLEPLSLGCGQTPLIDLWPLWLLRQAVRTALSVSKLPHLLPSSSCDLSYMFPFSDIDEI